MMGSKKKKETAELTAANADRHVLYEASVQAVDAHIEFVEETFLAHRNRKPLLLREDFCGTARLAAEWASVDPSHRAWGVDLDPDTLDWGRKRHVLRLGDQANRVTLIHDNVLNARTPPVDVTVAFNFSYSVFKTRDALRDYFAAALAGLNDQGMLVLDLFGGTGAVEETTEKQKIRGKRDPEGRRIPPFTYIWEHAFYNVINHDILCHIHFKFKDGSRIKKAFTYDWRLWTIPEIRELLLEAGFSRAPVYTHGWTEDGDSDDEYREVKSFENETGWLAFIVGLK